MPLINQLQSNRTELRLGTDEQATTKNTESKTVNKTDQLLNYTASAMFYGIHQQGYLCK